MKIDLQNCENAFLAMQLHKLRTLITRQSDELFNLTRVAVPSPCVSVVLFLAQNKKANITQISETLGYSHQLINQRLIQLQESGWVERLSDPRDGRRRVMALTTSGQRQANKIKSILPQAAQVFDDVFEEAGVNLLQAVKAVTDALEATPLTERIDSKFLEKAV